MLKLILFVSVVSLIRGAPAPHEHNPMEAGLFEGDIAGVEPTKGLGNIQSLLYTKWPEANGAKAFVPYTIVGSYSAYELDVIARGLKIVEDRTRVGNRDCIKFAERTNELTYLTVIRGAGCYSYIGKQRAPGKQELSLGNGCLYTMTVAHEFMHALGIWHEQSRPDRDFHVNIDFTSISESQKYNFDKYDSGNICNTGYDLKSVMHYDNYAFSINGKPTITAKNGTPLLPTWDKDDISDDDVKCLRDYYGCV